MATTYSHSTNTIDVTRHLEAWRHNAAQETYREVEAQNLRVDDKLYPLGTRVIAHHNGDTGSWFETADGKLYVVALTDTYRIWR